MKGTINHDARGYRWKLFAEGADTAKDTPLETGTAHTRKDAHKDMGEAIQRLSRKGTPKQ